MAIEVEVKVAVPDATTLHQTLTAQAPGEHSVYEDTYYDYPDRRLTLAGRREVRLRVIRTETSSKARLTFKDAMLDATSTPEHESGVEDPDAVRAILTGLGLEPVIAYRKECTNHAFEHAGHRVLATLVRVPEIDRWFLEVETLVPDDHPTDHALAVIWDVLTGLGLGPDDEESTFYIDLVTAHRARD
jgi:adenylate cyclase, class 2